MTGVEDCTTFTLVGPPAGGQHPKSDPPATRHCCGSCSNTPPAANSTCAVDAVGPTDALGRWSCCAGSNGQSHGGEIRVYVGGGSSLRNKHGQKLTKEERFTQSHTTDMNFGWLCCVALLTKVSKGSIKRKDVSMHHILYQMDVFLAYCTCGTINGVIQLLVSFRRFKRA